jgi:hypothetical protein
MTMPKSIVLWFILSVMGIHFTQVPPIGCGLGTSPLSRTR